MFVIRSKWMRVAIACLLLFSSVALGVETEPSAESVLAKLTSSMRTQSYRGVFTYEHGGSLETLDVTHVVVNGLEYERYLQLNGPEQVLTRVGREAACESLGGRIMRGSTLSSSQGKALHFNEYYHRYFKGYDRVAGRRVAVVQLLPKDNQRYGMSFGVDVESGVLLKALVMSRTKVLERMQFVAFEYQPLLDQGELDVLVSGGRAKASPPATQGCLQSGLTGGASATVPSGSVKFPSSGGDGYAQPVEHRADAPVAQTQQDALATVLPGDWQPGWVPIGFTLASSRVTEKDGVVHTYTDGLAAFSLFVNADIIESQQQAKARIPRGVAQRGATLVLMDVRRIGQAFVHITIVGEIPENSAAAVMQSVRARQSDGGRVIAPSVQG